MVAVFLALMGVGKLILVDMDTVELSNLNRQLLFTEKDIDEYKARVAAEKLREINPNVYVIDRNESLVNVPRRYFEESDVIVDGLDNFEARRWLNSVCVGLANRSSPAKGFKNRARRRERRERRLSRRSSLGFQPLAPFLAASRRRKLLKYC